MNFTKKQINQFRLYEQVRKSGHYNMFTQPARLATGLTQDEYMFVMENYSVLKEAYEAARANEMLLKAVDHS